jgi:DNA-binding transcriptional regulator YiaG
MDKHQHWLMRPGEVRQVLGIDSDLLEKVYGSLVSVQTPGGDGRFARPYIEALKSWEHYRPEIDAIRGFGMNPFAMKLASRQRQHWERQVQQTAQAGRLTTGQLAELLNVRATTVVKWHQKKQLLSRQGTGLKRNPHTYSAAEVLKVCTWRGPGL